MRWSTMLRLRLRSLFLRADVDRELDEELQYHFDRELEVQRAAGLQGQDAVQAARRAMGATLQNREACRDARGVSIVEHGVQDFRFAVRQLLANPGFTCTALTVLTLGLAAAVTIFGFVDAALIRPLPYTHSSELVHVFAARPDLVDGQDRGSVSYQDFRDWRQRNRTFTSIAAYDVRAGFNLTTSAGPERVRGLRVTSGFFRTLGVAPLLGREFRDDEEGPSAPATVMLSYAVWQTRFGADPAVLGRIVTLQFPWLPGGEPYVVIGVLPREFHFPMANEADFWAPIRGQQACWDARTCQSLEAIARLPDAVPSDAATANLSAIVAQLAAEYPNAREPKVAKLVPLREVMLGNIRPMLLMLLTAAGLLWLIASINAITLILARAETRRREIAVRTALGARPARLVLQFGTEALAVGGLSAALGLLLASWCMRALTGLISADMMARMPYFQDTGLTLHALGFGALLSIVVCLVLALVPLLRISPIDALGGLKEGSRGSGTLWRRAGAPLVAAELAIAMVLLVSAGLVGKSLYGLLHVDLGFNQQRLALFSVSPVSTETASATTPEEQPGRLASEVAEHVAAVPGVLSIGYADLSPLAPAMAPASTFWIVGRPEHEQMKETGPVRRISPGYFKTLQATFLRGRDFTATDLSTVRPVMIINNTAARRYFPGHDPIGQSIALGGPESPPREIVGIVADIKDGPPESPPYPAAYVPFDQYAFTLVVRTARPEHSVFSSIVAAVHNVRRGLLVQGETTMAEQITRMPSTSLNRSSAWLVSGFASIAFILGIVGLYGMVAYTVGQRTREIGVRMALGARPPAVYRLVLGDAGRLVCIGSAIGIAAAIGAGTLMRHVLFATESWDPATLCAASGALVLSALLASYIPARRAASVDPVEVLRAE